MDLSNYTRVDLLAQSYSKSATIILNSLKELQPYGRVVAVLLTAFSIKKNVRKQSQNVDSTFCKLLTATPVAGLLVFLGILFHPIESLNTLHECRKQSTTVIFISRALNVRRYRSLTAGDIWRYKIFIVHSCAVM